jgi:hypothetical protein
MGREDRPLLVVPEWIEAHCVIPDRSHSGLPFYLADEQLSFVAKHYTVRGSAKFNPDAERDPRLPKNPLADAFVFRRSQLVRAQKWGKSPLISAFVCVEGVGPALFAGWASEGDVYDCAEHGCFCGWVYEYSPGEPMGRPWSSPLIQITATSEDQTDNTYDALRPMIELGPLADLIPKTGEEFIRLPGDGRIDVVTSKGNSRLGQRVTFVVQDETGLWVRSNGGHNLAKKQRQGLAGMGGRAIETTNAWDPAADSVAQRTYESQAKDVNRDFRHPPANLSFKNKAERRKIFQFNYAGAPWVSVDTIEGEAAEMMEKDPADAERFFGNRLVAGAGKWVTEDDWESKKAPAVVEPRTSVAMGMDLSNNNDWTGIRLETADQYQFTPTYMVGGDERLTVWDPANFGGFIPRGEVRAAVDYLASEYRIVRAYIDPAGSAMGAIDETAMVDDDSWRTELAEWAAKYGTKVFIPWPTNSITPMHKSLEQFRSAIRNPDSKFRHDGDTVTKTHITNAVMIAKTGQRYVLGKPHGADHQKIDMAMSSDLAHEAAMDATTAGEFVVPVTDSRMFVFR